MNSLVATVLNKVLGEWLEDIDPNRLDLSIFSGTVQLGPASIKSDALDQFGFPFVLQLGFVNKVYVSIPWTSLGSSPMRIEIEGVSLYVSPRPKSQWSSFVELANQVKRQKSQLANFELMTMTHPVPDSPNYVSHAVTKIINNLEVRVHGVYLRYEDTVNASSPFSLGLILQKLEAVTCNREWVPEFVDESEVNYKRISVEGFGLFFDYGKECNSALYYGREESETAKFKRFAKEETELRFQFPHKFVLSPVKTIVDLEINQNPRNKSIPQVALSLVIGDKNTPLKCAWETPQLTFLLRLADFYEEFVAYQSGIFGTQETQPFEESKGREYREQYKIWKKTVDTGDRKRAEETYLGLEALETKHSLEDILFMRKAAIREEKLEAAERESERKVLSLSTPFKEGKLSRVKTFIGLGLSDSERQSKEDQRRKEQEEAKAVLEQVKLQRLKFKSDLQSFLFTESLPFDTQDAAYTRFQVNIRIPEYSFSLKSVENDLMRVFMNYFTVELSLKATGGFLVKTSFNKILVRDDVSKSEIYPNLLETGRIRIELDKSLPDSLKLTIPKTEQLTIVANLDSLFFVVSEVKKAVTDQVDINRLKRVAKSKADQYIEAGRKLMKQIVQGQYRPQVLDLNVDLKAPCIFIPLNTQEAGNALVLDFGNILISSTLATSQSRQFPSELGVLLPQDLYDHIRIEVDEVEIGTLWRFESLEQWRKGMVDSLFKPSKFVANIWTCREPLHVSYPALVTDICLDRIAVTLSDVQLSLLLQINQALTRLNPVSDSYQSPEISTKSDDSRLGKTVVDWGRVISNHFSYQVRDFSVTLIQETTPVLRLQLQRSLLLLSSTIDGNLLLDYKLRDVTVEDLRNETKWRTILGNPTSISEKTKAEKQEFAEAENARFSDILTQEGVKSLYQQGAESLHRSDCDLSILLSLCSKTFVLSCTVTINEMRLIINKEIPTVLSRFSLDLLPQSFRGKILSSLMEKLTPNSIIPSPTRSRTVTLKVLLRRVEVWTPLDPYLPNSKVLAVYMESTFLLTSNHRPNSVPYEESVSFVDDSAAIEISKIGAVVGYEKDGKTVNFNEKDDFIKPFRFHVAFEHLLLLENRLKSTLEIDIETFELALGFRDLFFLRDLWRRMNGVLPPLFSLTNFLIKPQRKPGSNLSENPSNHELLVRWKCEIMQVSFYDDTEQRLLALLKVHTLNVSAEASYVGNAFALSLSGAIESSYYNSLVHVWEPVLEFWPLDLSLLPSTPDQSLDPPKRSLHFQHIFLLSAELKSDRPLRLNLTYSMIKSMAGFLRKLRETSSEMEDTSVQIEKNKENGAVSKGVYTIKNRCGAEFEFWREGSGTVRDMHRFYVEESGRESIHSDLAETAGFRSHRKYTNMLQAPEIPVRIGLKISDLPPIRGIAIGVPGVYGYGREKRDPKHAGILVNIKAKDDRMVVSVESKLKVANNCWFECVLEHENGEKTVFPNTWTPVPCTWLTNIQAVMLRTRDGTLFPLLDTSGIVRFFEDLFIVIDHIWVSKVNEANPEESHVLQHIILLNPPLTICNSFPCKLTFKPVSSDTETVLEPGEEKSVFNVNLEAENEFVWKVMMPEGTVRTKGEKLVYNTGMQHYLLEGDVPCDKLSLDLIPERPYNLCPGLDLSFSSRSSYNGSLLHLFSQYWIINHTDFPLEFQGEKPGFRVSGNSIRMIKCERESMRVRIQERTDFPASEWSESFNITTRGIAGLLTLDYPSPLYKCRFHPRVYLGLLVSAGKWPIVKSTLIHIYPRYVFHSDFPIPLILKQNNSVSSIEIQPNQTFPYQFEDGTRDPHLQLSSNGENWSSPFSIDEIEDFQVRCRGTDSRGRDWWLPSVQNGFLLYVNVSIMTETEATIFVNFGMPTDHEIRIKNESRRVVEIRQENCEIGMMARPGDILPFAYDNRLEEVKRVTLTSEGQSCAYVFDKVKTFKELLGGLEITVEPDMRTKVVTIREKQSQDLSKPLLVQAIDPFQNFNLVISIPGFELSIQDAIPKERFLLSLTDLDLKLERRFGCLDTSMYTKLVLNITIGRIQLDDMTAGKSEFPVVFRSRDSGSSGENQTEDTGVPFLQVQAALDRIDRYDGERLLSSVDRVEYAGIQLQEMSVNVHQDTITEAISELQRLARWFEIEKAAISPSSKSPLLSLSDTCPDLTPSMPILDSARSGTVSKKAFFQHLNLNAMKIILSLRGGTRKQESILALKEAFGILGLFSRLGTDFPINDATINLNTVIIVNSFQTIGSLLNLIRKNYVRQGVFQFYRLLGSSDLIGNPLGLIDKLGTGVFEFFSQPIKGLMKSPQDFAEGIGKGVKALVQGVVAGSFGSVSKLTGSLYTIVQGVSGASKSSYRLPAARDNVASGLYYGMKGGIQDLTEGVAGIFMKPLKGARKNGVSGFLKGAGFGVIGVVTAPFAAVLRVSTSLSSSVVVQATVTYEPSLGRMRQPRQFGPRRILEPYNAALAEAQVLLHSLPLDISGNMTFFAEVTDTEIVFLTERNLMYVSDRGLEKTLPLHRMEWVQLKATNRGFFLQVVSDRAPLRLYSPSFQRLAKIYMALDRVKDFSVNSSLVSLT